MQTVIRFFDRKHALAGYRLQGVGIYHQNCLGKISENDFFAGWRYGRVMAAAYPIIKTKLNFFRWPIKPQKSGRASSAVQSAAVKSYYPTPRTIFWHSIKIIFLVSSTGDSLACFFKRGKENVLLFKKVCYDKIVFI